MKLFSAAAIFVGVSVAVAGATAPSRAQVVLALGQTDCAQLFSDDPGIVELVVPEVASDPVDGVSDNGTLAVEIAVTRGTRTEPTTLDWRSVSVPGPLPGDPARPAKPVKAVLVQHGDGNTRGYLYPTGALFDSGLTGPVLSAKTIVKTRFCYGGSTTTLASVAPCPLSSEILTGETESALQRACDALAPAAYFQFMFPRGSDLGPRDGEGPAVCVCETGVVNTPGRIVTSRFCNISDRTAPDACFPLGTPEQPGRNAFSTNVDEFVRASGSECAIQCTTIDGLRFCSEFCLPSSFGG